MRNDVFVCILVVQASMCLMVSSLTSHCEVTWYNLMKQRTVNTLAWHWTLLLSCYLKKQKKKNRRRTRVVHRPHTDGTHQSSSFNMGSTLTHWSRSRSSFGLTWTYTHVVCTQTHCWLDSVWPCGSVRQSWKRGFCSSDETVISTISWGSGDRLHTALLYLCLSPLRLLLLSLCRSSSAVINSSSRSPLLTHSPASLCGTQTNRQPPCPLQTNTVIITSAFVKLCEDRVHVHLCVR